MPAIIAKTKEMQLIAQTKKVYSTIANALLTAQKDLGSIGYNNVLFDQSNTSIQTARQFVKYFKDAKLCESRTQTGCSQFFYPTKYALPRAGTNDKFEGFNYNVPTIILSSGAIIRIEQVNSGNADCLQLWNTCKTDEYGRCLTDDDGNILYPVIYTFHRCGYIRFDVNGIKGPNRFGEDNFGTIVSLNKLEPEPWNAIGYTSLLNILSGKNKLEYTNYEIGEDIKN